MKGNSPASDQSSTEDKTMADAKTKELLPIYADGEIGARILAAMEAYRREYVYSPEYGSDHEPTDFEQVLLEDFLNGAFTDEVSAILQEAARVAAPQPADVPHDVVRALKWKRDKLPTTANTIAGEYVIYNGYDGVIVCAGPDYFVADVTTVEAAKSAAQAHYAKRIRSALAAPAPSTSTEPSLDDWAYAFANWRQGQRSTPSCEAPGEADIRICRDLIKGMLACRPSAPSTSTEEAKPCEYCDGTGDVCRADGEWLGTCDCGSALTEESAVVLRKDILEWRAEWLDANDPQDGSDCVTPFDKYLYSR